MGVTLLKKGCPSLLVLSLNSVNSSQWILRKNPLCFRLRESNATIWHTSENSSQQGRPWEKAVLPQPNLLGLDHATLHGRREIAISSPSSHLALVRWLYRQNQAVLEQSRSRGPRFTQRLRSNYRPTELSLAAFYHCVTESSPTVVSFSQYIMSAFQQKIRSHTKRQKKIKHWTNIKTRVRYGNYQTKKKF